MKTVGTTAALLTRSATNQLFRLLFPPICAGCDIHVAEPGTLCGACWSRVRFIEKPCCPVLGIPFSHDLGAEILSAEAIADPPPFRRARSVAAHEGVIRDMVHRLKYNDRTDLGPWMARFFELQARLEALLGRKIDLTMPSGVRTSRRTPTGHEQVPQIAAVD